MPFDAELVRDPGDERASGPTTTRSAQIVTARLSEPLGVLGPHRMATPERGDSRVARGRVKLGQAGALRETPRKCVLSRTGADDHNLHAGECTSGV